MQATDFLDFIGDEGLVGLERLKETLKMINIETMIIDTKSGAIKLVGRIDYYSVSGEGSNLENAICEYWKNHGELLEIVNKRIRAEVEAQKVGPASAA